MENNKIPKNNKKDNFNSVFFEDCKKESFSIIAEICFIILPFIVILFMKLIKSDIEELLQTSDWSLASAILFGQTIVKLVMGVSAREQSFEYQRFGFITSLIIVFGLVPSIILIIVFQFIDYFSPVLVIIQFVLLIIAFLTFLTFGTVGQVLFSTSFRYKIAKILFTNPIKD